LLLLRPIGLIIHLIRLGGRLKSRELEMALARQKSRRVNGVSIPLACEVCRERPVTRLVVNFIFACDVCAKRISAALWNSRQELALPGKNFSSEREM
jgi:ribosomal protein L37AE/L43A